MGAYYKKLFSVRKRANWLHSAASSRAAAGRRLSVGKGFAFFDGLSPYRL